MQIACPQCSMKYDLDERLLPPGGAPVQCTRCGHVFTAQAPGRAPATGGPRVPNPDPGPAVRRQTLVFGGHVGEGGPAAGRAPAPEGAGKGGRSGTQVFGAGGGEPPATRATQVFGKDGGAPPARGGTQVFGAPATGAPPARSTTQVFGAPAPRQEPPQRSGTQVFGVPAAAPPASTPAAPAPPAAPPARSATQLFGVAPRAGTQQFGTVTPEEAAAEAPAPQAPVYGKPAAPAGPGPDTLPFGEPVVRPGAASLPSLPRFEPPLARPERPSAPESPPARSGTRWVVLALVVLAALAAALVWARRARSSVQESSRAATLRQELLTLLRKDDAASQEEAVRRLRERVAAEPTDVAARSDLALALAFRTDDTQLAAQLLETRRAALQRQEDVLRRQQSPADWEGRAAALAEERGRLEAGLVPLNEQAAALRAELSALRMSLDGLELPAGPTEALAVLRGRAIAAAVLDGQGALGFHAAALERAEGGAPWLAVARAEAALRPGTPAALATSAAAGLAPVREQDRASVRPYVLGARLALATDDAPAALSLLEAASTFNPQHGLARQLADVARGPR